MYDILTYYFHVPDLFLWERLFFSHSLMKLKKEAPSSYTNESCYERAKYKVPSKIKRPINSSLKAHWENSKLPISVFINNARRERLRDARVGRVLKSPLGFLTGLLFVKLFKKGLKSPFPAPGNPAKEILASREFVFTNKPQTNHKGKFSKGVKEAWAFKGVKLFRGLRGGFRYSPQVFDSIVFTTGDRRLRKEPLRQARVKTFLDARLFK